MVWVGPSDVESARGRLTFGCIEWDLGVPPFLDSVCQQKLAANYSVVSHMFGLAIGSFFEPTCVGPSPGG